jgi:diguanylate cyclase (GGDEF)-like protein
MNAIYSCISESHDRSLLLLAAAICTIGVHASFSVARHAGRLDGRGRKWWSLVAIVAAGSTAWATHMIGLLAFRPGMLSGFDPILTAASLVLAIVGIGLAVGTAIGTRNRFHRLGSGLLLGLSITLLHYLGQSAYLVTGRIGWNDSLVALSTLLSMPLFCAAMVISGEKRRALKHLAAPFLVIAIAILHFTGMTALQLQFDPSVDLPASTLSPEIIAPIVASVSVALLILAFLGLRFTLAARAQLRRDQLRLKQLADMAVEGLLICEEDIVQAMNNSFASLSGYAKDKLAGALISDVLPNLVISTIAEQEETDAELLHADGKLMPVRVLRKTVTFGSRHQTVIAVRDQSERLRTEGRLHALAYSDALTGLSNRMHFNQLLEARLDEAAAQNKSFALLLLDLDRFKSVNDTLGHVVGDELLKRVASRICATVQAADIVARLGGDEFAVIVADLSRAEGIAETIIDLLSRPFLIEASVIDVAGSIGVATALRDGQDPGTLYRHADLALYAAKQDGGATSRHFEAQMSERAKARRSLELDLRRALTREEFEVYYQPQVDPKSGRYQGAEALVRWRHPTRGMVSPADFIPLAEEIGLVGALGEWVLRTACEEATSWPHHLSVAVNLSPVQLRDSNIASTIAHILQETGLPATRLELEITESALMQDEDLTFRILQTFRKMGIRISMDDFGTGYSSLSYLQRFPFTKIKIDQSFVRQLPDNPDAVAIVQAITSLAGKLRMSVTAEGVETVGQRAFTVKEGCDQIQGYLISRPMEQAAIRALFTETDKAVA